MASKCHLGYIVEGSLDFCCVCLLEQLHTLYASLVLAGRQIKRVDFPRRTPRLYTAWHWCGMGSVGCLNSDCSYNNSILQLKMWTSQVESGSKVATHFVLCPMLIEIICLQLGSTKDTLVMCATKIHKSHIV